MTNINNNTLNINEFSFTDIKNLDQLHRDNWQIVGNLIRETGSFLSEVENNVFIEYKEFYEKLWNILDNLHESTKHLSKEDLKKKQLFFRGSLFYFLNKSLIFSRALTKPYGYPGDFIMLQALYDKNPVSDSRIGQYFDQYSMDDTLTRAVINRAEAMGDRVIKFINESKKPELNILNIASGSGSELRKITKCKFDKKVIYHCFDQEVASLSYIGKNFLYKNPNVEIRLYREDIRTFFRNWKENSKFDFIYNIGLADYLPDRIMVSLIKESLGHLSDNGVFVLAHKDYTLFPYHHHSWISDWNFIHRDLNSYKDLLKNTISEEFSIWFESDKKIVYFSEFQK
jgi:extracellular factor (EF) 3-hydroxypalmitic acid methyl ester biosynthesis protein